MKSELKMGKGEALIILAGIFWGSMGIFVRRLAGYGFSSIQIVAIRVTLAAAGFCGILLITDRRGFRISLRDIPLFLGLGIGSVLMFTVCYFTAISRMSLSAAAILLYTSPIWIMLMSAVFFRERMNGMKLAALPLAFLCVLTALITAVIPFLSYTRGLETVEAGRAGILATVEPMVATVMGAAVFSEPLSVLSLIGIAMIFSSVVMLNVKRHEPET
ncbi:MAG: DMT family transporter [Eubacteriaceae bacterium]|nr:DMT family transporter [Eubacteriaceae bacterium]